eukprot:m51a1_g7435 hypothetical protein (1198) ;mRNA; r:53945-58599
MQMQQAEQGEEALNKMTVVVLRELCKQHGLPTAGIKAVLIQRLCAMQTGGGGSERNGEGNTKNKRAREDDAAQEPLHDVCGPPDVTSEAILLEPLTKRAAAAQEGTSTDDSATKNTRHKVECELGKRDDIVEALQCEPDESEVAEKDSDDSETTGDTPMFSQEEGMPMNASQEEESDSISADVLLWLKTKCQLPTFATADAAAWKVLYTKHELCFNDTEVDTLWRIWVDPDEPNGSRYVRDLEERFLATIGWADKKKTTRSMLGYIHAMFSIPLLEGKLYDGPGKDENGDETEPEIISNYTESKDALAWKKAALERHNNDPQQCSKQAYALTYALYADKYSWKKKQSGRAILLDVLNGAQGLRNLQFFRFNIAESDGTVYGNSLSLLSILCVLRPEATVAYDGVEVWCEALKETVWVYLKLGALIADSQERCWFVSVNPPSGKANYCCPMCDATLEQFARGELGDPRDFAAAVAAVHKARAVLVTRQKGTEEKAHEILSEQHLHWTALFNPLFDWPGVTNLFELPAADNLHLVLFYFKVLPELLISGLDKDQRETLAMRVTAANAELPVHLRMVPLHTRGNWIGRESRNFGLCIPYLLLYLSVPKDVLKLWTKVATFFSLLYSPSSTQGLVAVVSVLSREVVRGILGHYPRKTNKDGTTERQAQLNLHSPLHLANVMLHRGPPCIWDTERAENTQSKIASFSRLTSVNMAAYTLRNAASWQTACMSRIQNDPKSRDAALVRWRTEGSCQVVQPRYGKRAPHVVYEHIPLVPGTVVCTLPANDVCVTLDENPQCCSDLSREFYTYYVVKEVTDSGIRAQQLVSPKRGVPLAPFPLCETAGATEVVQLLACALYALAATALCVPLLSRRRRAALCATSPAFARPLAWVASCVAFLSVRTAFLAAGSGAGRPSTRGEFVVDSATVPLLGAAMLAFVTGVRVRHAGGGHARAAGATGRCAGVDRCARGCGGIAAAALVFAVAVPHVFLGLLLVGVVSLTPSPEHAGATSSRGRDDDRAYYTHCLRSLHALASLAMLAVPLPAVCATLRWPSPSLPSSSLPPPHRLRRACWALCAVCWSCVPWSFGYACTRREWPWAALVAGCALCEVGPLAAQCLWIVEASAESELCGGKGGERGDEARRGRECVVALAMGRHPRLGLESPLREISVWELRAIAERIPVRVPKDSAVALVLEDRARRWEAV